MPRTAGPRKPLGLGPLITLVKYILPVFWCLFLHQLHGCNALCVKYIVGMTIIVYNRSIFFTSVFQTNGSKQKQGHIIPFLQVNLVPWCPNVMFVTCFGQNTIRMKHNSSLTLPKQPCSEQSILSACLFKCKWDTGNPPTSATPSSAL